MRYNYKNKCDIRDTQDFLLNNNYSNTPDKHPDDLTRKYIYKHTQRFLFSLGFLSALKPGDKVLEIGAMPYCFSTLLIELFKVEVSALNLPNTIFPGEPYNMTKENVVIPNKKTHKEYEVGSWICNAEKDIYPFQNRFFDAVICTEVLEHLLYSPAHVFQESHRVLKDNGIMLISTVNSLYYKRMVDIILNNNIDDVFTTLGCYGRHNRNWTRQELSELAESNRFKVQYLTSASLRGTRNVYGSVTATTPIIYCKKKGKNKILRKILKSLRKIILNLTKLIVFLPLYGLKDKRHSNIFLLLKKI